MGNYDEQVKRIREFSRFYLPLVAPFGNRYFGSDYSVTEARILFEIDENDGCTSSSIVKTLSVDKSYLSRILKDFEKKGFLWKTPMPSDRRSYELHLTEEGKKTTVDINERVDSRMRVIVSRLTDEEWDKVDSALDIITDLFSKKENQPGK